MRTLPQSLVRGAVLQMAKAAPQNQRFGGISENAVRIKIYYAIITCCLVAIVQHDMKLKRSIYEILQILGISLTDKTHIRDLFDKKNINDVNGLYGFSEQNLFNF